MSTKGIRETKVRASNNYKSTDNNKGRFVEYNDLSSQISVFVDEECLLYNTENPKNTLKDIKWIVVEETVWNKLLWK